MQTDSQLREGTILLVDTRCTVLRRFGDSLQRAGYDVVQAASFEDAKHAIVAHHPDLLVSHVRLGAFNGLHLLHLGRLIDPELEVIIIASSADVVLKHEVEALGALLLAEPLQNSDVLGAAATLFDARLARRLMAREYDRRRGERRQIIIAGYAPERRLAERRISAVPVTAHKTIA